MRTVVMLVMFVAVAAMTGCADDGGRGYDAGGDGVLVCQSGRTLCGRACVDVRSDAYNCGGCGRACVTGAACVDGACTPTCSTPRRMCGPDCVDVSSDTRHCAQCDRPCAAGESCMSGLCVPPVVDRCRGRMCGPDNFGGSCGTCANGLECDASGTCRARAQACSAAFPAGTCPAGQTCVGGACCSTEQACGSVCCAASATCVVFSTGERRCATRCNTNGDCPDSSAGCCSPLNDRDNPGRLRPFGACLTFGQNGVSQCRCATGTECQSGSCAPSVDAQSNPTRPYVCKAAACAPYQRCTGLLGSCPNGYCNLCDEAGNCFCAAVCRDSTQCGGALCASYARSIGSCANTQLACRAR